MGQRGEEWVSEVRGRRKIGEVRNGRQGETQVGQREVWSGSVASFTGGKQQRSSRAREHARTCRLRMASIAPRVSDERPVLFACALLSLRM